MNWKGRVALFAAYAVALTAPALFFDGTPEGWSFRVLDSTVFFFLPAGAVALLISLGIKRHSPSQAVLGNAVSLLLVSAGLGLVAVAIAYPLTGLWFRILFPPTTAMGVGAFFFWVWITDALTWWLAFLLTWRLILNLPAQTAVGSPYR